MNEQILKARILIVDDQDANIALLEAVLTQAGYTNLQTLNDPRQVHAIYEAAPPDLLLLDLRMPHMDGIAVLEDLATLRSPADYCPILVLTADLSTAAKHRALEIGAKDFLTKPVDRIEVLLRVRNLLETRILYQQAQERVHQLSARVQSQQVDLHQLEVERIQAKEQARKQAGYDGLTGLPNRMQVQEQLRATVDRAAKEQVPVALLMLDIDRFKEINRGLGMAEGDLFLREVAQRLKKIVRPVDTLARIGGDEFAVIVPEAGAAGAAWAARKLLSVFATPFSTSGVSIQASASIGVTLYPDHADDALALWRQADVALSTAKKTASGYSIYAEQQDIYSVSRLTLLSELQQALVRDELVLQYQPKVGLDSGATCGLEALVRWQHPVHGMMPPGKFIALAEQTGLITSITHWVLQSALQQYQQWRRTGLEIPVAVNVSMRCIHDPQLPKLIQGLLHRYGVDPAALTLEITETALAVDQDRAETMLSQIAATGVHLSVDDFGTGYSTLSHLSRLPVDEIKIDRSFVSEMLTNARAAHIVRTVIELGERLGLQVVAEGVELPVHWQQLRDWQCATAQGYYVSRPLGASDMRNWLLSSPFGLHGAMARSNAS